MIELSYEKLSNQGFLHALQNLAQQRMPVKAAYNVKKLCDAVMKARKEVGQEYMDTVVEKFAQRDDKGAKIEVDGQIQFKDETPEEKDEFIKTQDEFGKKMKQIPRERLVMGVDIPGSLETSAAELSVLDPVIADVSELPQAPVLPFPGGSSNPPDETA